MAARNRGLGKLFIVLFFGLSWVGRWVTCWGISLPDGVVKEFFVRAVTAAWDRSKSIFTPSRLRWASRSGVNVMSVVGVILAAYYFRWY